MKALRQIRPWGLILGCGFALIEVLAACPTQAQTKPRVIQTGSGAESIHVVDLGGRLQITEGPGSRDLELPADTRIDALEKTATGWVAAGHYAARSGGELLLLQQKGGEVALLPAPPGREDRFRGTPAIFVAKGRLSGIAWLEGTSQDNLAVRAARWTGSEWGETEIVSPQGPGAQLALRGAILSDGSWLLVWAAVDGEDDDIWWSRRATRVEDGWSSPKRVHADNPVPDVTPAVLAVPSGALVAWSWYDGRDYRIRTARFDGVGWSEPGILEGRGATDAKLLRHTGGFSLVYRTVVPGAWHVVDFDQSARAHRRAAVTAERTDLPVLEWTTQGPRFDWPQPAFHWPAESRVAPWAATE